MSQATVYDWVGDILASEREERQAKVWRVTRLGWTQVEIGNLVGVDDTTISRDLKNSESGISQVRDLLSQGRKRYNDARRFNLPPILVGAIRLDVLDDAERMKVLAEDEFEAYIEMALPGPKELTTAEAPKLAKDQLRKAERRARTQAAITAGTQARPTAVARYGPPATAKGQDGSGVCRWGAMAGE